MGDDTTQPTRIGEDVYERLKSHTKRKHGQLRGSLRDELELAINNHVNGELPADELARIENDVATIKAAIVGSDGGEVVVADPPAPSPDGSHTHTPADTTNDDRETDQTDAHDAPSTSTTQTAGDTEDDAHGDETPDKPHRKATKGAKAEYVFETLRSGSGGVVVPPGAIDKKIERAWDFGSRATAGVRDRVFKRYHAVPASKETGTAWEVAIAETPEAVDEAIDNWSEDGEEVRTVPHEHFAGFDDGMPVTE